MENVDEKMWGLEITQCDDGDILIGQGVCGCGDDVTIRLHRCHLPLIAELGGFVPVGEVARAVERLQDRLNLLASMVRAHTQPNDPLRIVLAASQQGNENPISCSQVTSALSFGDGCLPNVAGRTGVQPEQDIVDLFSDTAGGKQGGG